MASPEGTEERLKAALADRYLIDREVGSGGMATVYLAQDLKHERKVAVKVLRPELAAVLGVDRFLQEIKVTANLHHPHILPLFDSGAADGFLYYVMPFVEGETLQDQLRRERQLPVEDAVRITAEVANALGHAHRHDIVHRDIKPGNILLLDGQALVADFGIALAVTAAGGSRVTETGLSLGTPEYMSPEQATGDRQIDARSDVYSLGAVLYELLIGEPPHRGPTVQAVISRVVTEDAEPVTIRRPTVPVNVDAALRKALAKFPADRFASATQFAEALTDPTFTLPTMARAMAAPLREGPWRRLALGAAGLAAVLAVVAGIAFWGWLGPIDKPVTRASLAWSGELSPLALATFALSPDGSMLVFVGGDEGDERLLMRKLDELHSRALPGTEGASAPFFSPGGNSVAFFVRDAGDLKVLSLEGGPPRTVVKDSARETAGGDWGPDGMLYFGGVDGGIWRVPAEGGEAESVSTLDTIRGDRAHQFVDVLPNGKGAIVSVWRGAAANMDVGVLRFETGEVQLLLPGSQGRFAPSGHLVFVRSDGTLSAAPFDVARLELTGPSTVLVESVEVHAYSGFGRYALSETGTLVYQTDAGGHQQAVWVDLDGATTPIDSQWRGSFYSLALSPDGTRLAATLATPGRYEIWVKQLDRGPLTRLASGGSVNYRSAWTADGRSLTFISDRSGQLALWMKRADGSAPAELLVDHDRGVDQGFWSRDGQWVVFRTGDSFRTRDLHAIRPGVDTVPRTLVASDADEYAAALSPDGRWLAYVSEESGRQEVYVRPFPATGEAKWQVSVEGGRGPVWAHSGQQLFYQTERSDLVVTDLELEPTFLPGIPRVLLQGTEFATYYWHPMFDVAPNDQRFVMIRQAGVQESELILVLNWFEELKAKVGGSS